MNNKKNIKRDKHLFILIVLILVFSPLLQVVTRAKLSEVNIEVEKIKNNIEKQEKLNESINMQINELASLDKIREIADKNGLSYKNNNITSIDGVKKYMKEESEVSDLVKGLPEIPDAYKPKLKLITRKPILPSAKELEENSRSKSAKLRVAVKL